VIWKRKEREEACVGLHSPKMMASKGETRELIPIVGEEEEEERSKMVWEMKRRKRALKTGKGGEFIEWK